MSIEAKEPKEEKEAKPSEPSRDDAGGAQSIGSKVTISAPDRVERREMLDVLAEAFLDNPMNVAIHPGSPKRRLRANRAGLRALVLRPAESAVLRVGRINGRVFGGFVVVRPHGYPLRNIKFVDKIGCLVHQGWRGVRCWEQVDRALTLSHPSHHHWYLAVLGVSPSLWGRGLGTQLVRELDALVADEPAPIYLESDRANSVRFYRSRGFSIREERKVLGVRCACLERPVALPSDGV